MMHQVLKAFPDDKPITAICIVEDSSKCPPGFYVVSRTHDQDSDADLWREGNFFGRKILRYLCLSKTEGIADYVVENVGVINEKETPPDGYCLIPRTLDSEQRAWRKRQMCYRLTRRNLALSAITDIILLSRTKKAPEGFSLAGDINGVAVCFKTGLVHQDPPPAPVLGYSLNPLKLSDLRPAPRIPTSYNDSSPTHDYENLIRPSPSVPTRPAPPRPPPVQSAYSTIASYHGLEGIPFVINPKLVNAPTTTAHLGIPIIKARTQFELDKEYDYDFRLERQT